MSEAATDSDGVTRWLADLKEVAKSEEAARKLWEKYHRLLEWRVAWHIADQYQGKMGPESVVQEAFLSFFQRHKAGEYHIPDRTGLLSLLGQMVFNKTVSGIRRLEADKRSPGGGESLNGELGDGAAEERSSDLPQEHQLADQRKLGAGKEVIYQEPVQRCYRPSHPVSGDIEHESCYEQAPLDLFLAEAEPHVPAEVKESLAELSDFEQQVFLLGMQGFGDVGIADRLGIEPGAVRRKRKIIAAKWERKCD